jgi:hypothetical protein
MTFELSPGELQQLMARGRNEAPAFGRGRPYPAIRATTLAVRFAAVAVIASVPVNRR